MRHQNLVHQINNPAKAEDIILTIKPNKDDRKVHGIKQKTGKDDCQERISGRVPSQVMDIFCALP